MKKAISVALILAVVILAQSVAFAANCRTPSSATISLEKDGQHSATAKISGVTTHSGQSSRDNSLSVSIHVKVGIRPGSATQWYSWTSNSATDKSSCSKTQKVTPVTHYLIGAEGSWTAVCYFCDVNSRFNSGSIPYKKL